LFTNMYTDFFAFTASPAISAIASRAFSLGSWMRS
jgi:hypothetical protein